MDLKLYNTLTRSKEPFRPIDPARVRMYVCGPTVYDFAHIGNARPVIVFDVLFRLLRHIYGPDHVKYVRNITDVDDKINARAAERDISIRELTKKTYAEFTRDVKFLRCRMPTVEPRATEHIEEMRTLIELLVESGCAYVAEEHVLFHVASMKDYGKLSNRSLDEMMAGARVDVAPFKRDPMDFVLWKPSKQGEPGWPSPCGIGVPGRPGWHIECSAMSWKHLGKTFDIHGGGIDLVFPHHENELAQSRCAFHTGVMANVWMHNGFLQVEGEKMSKSLGNFITIRELYRTKKFGGRKWEGSVLRFAMLQTHYRQPIDWTVKLLEQSEQRLRRWQNFAAERTVRRRNKELFNKFLGALKDDLNTPEAFAIVDQAISNEYAADEDRFTVYRILNLLGLRSPQTRAARTAEHLESIQRNISLLSRVLLSNENYEKSSEYAAYLDALDQFRHTWAVYETGAFHIVSRWNRTSEHFSTFKLENIKTYILELGHFTRNDWHNFQHAVSQSPRFKNETLKPEAKLFNSINAIANFWKARKQEIPNLTPAPDSVNRVFKQITPAETDFEAIVRRLIADRNAARVEKRFTDADNIRNQLAQMGVVLKDNKDGTTTWEVAR